MQEIAKNLPLDCIGAPPYEDTYLIGRPCEGCTELSLPDGCPVRQVGMALIQQEAIIIDKEWELAQRAASLSNLIERLLAMRYDSLVKSTTTPEGLRDLLQSDEQLRQEAQQGAWGVVRFDGRFVEYMNRFGNEVGDMFLESGGKDLIEITDGLLRTRTRRSENEHIDKRPAWHTGKLDYPDEYDIICREGGDEFVVLVRHVNPEQLQTVAARIAARLTVEYALERYEHGKAPFIASVGYAHVGDMPADSSGAMTKDPWDMFTTLNALADAGQRTQKDAQYEQMLALALAAMPPEGADQLTRQLGKTEITTMFLHYRCPKFYEDPVSYLQS